MYEIDFVKWSCYIYADQTSKKLKTTKCILVLLHFIICCYTSLYATSVVLTNPQIDYSFIEKIELFKEANPLSLDEAKNQIYLPYSEWKDKLEANQTYWGKFQIENQTSIIGKDREWVLNFSLQLTNVEVFVIYPNGNVERGRSGFFTPLSERTFVPIVKGNFIKIDIPVGEEVSIFIRAECERIGTIPEFDVQLSSTTFFFNSLNKKRQYLSLFIGFVMMMLVYNLFLYFYSAKDQAYISYSIYLSAIIFFSMYNGGDIADIFVPRFFSKYPQMITFAKVIVYFVIIGYLSFLRSFLNLSELHPKWNIFFKYFSVCIFPVLLFDVFSLYRYQFNYSISDIPTIGTGIFFIITVFIFCGFLYQTKNKKGYFVIAGTLFMGGGSLLMILDRFRTADFSTFYFRIGIILEIIIFSLGLAFRRKEIEREKQEAFFELEKNKLIQIQEHNEAERLKELDNLKNRLYTNITHEFRTPLTVIMGTTDNVKGNKKEKEIIQRNSSQLLRLINQMLDLSKIESNLIQLNWVQLDMVTYLQYITESFHSMARDKNVRLTFYSEEESIWMDIDESKIEHLTYNLISNAIKFTPPGGKVVFHVKKEINNSTTYLQIKIKDTGVGISEADLPNIFNRFYQNHNQKTGTGIGLALVKEIVDLLQGTIEVKSNLEVGSEFIITLPIRQKAEKSFSHKDSEIIIDDKFIEPNKEVQLEKEVIHSEKPILLLIEDNKDIANYVQELLSKKYEVNVASNGQVGIDTAFRIIPDIIISDVMMPEKDGYEVTRILKYDERTSHIPIILLTAKATQKDKMDGLESGADAFLMKPFHKKELLVRLEKLHHQRKQLIEKFTSGSFDIPNKINSEKTKTVSLNEVFHQKIKQAILENITNPKLNVSDLCEITGLGNTQVYRKIKALTGLTPTLFIRSTRLHHAKKLLKSGSFNVSEVAYKVGFTDPNYFSRVFFQEFDKNASEFINH